MPEHGGRRGILNMLFVGVEIGIQAGTFHSKQDMVFPIGNK
jgi:hypothetical protein